MYGLSSEGYHGDIYSFVVEGEFLSNLYPLIDDLASDDPINSTNGILWVDLSIVLAKKVQPYVHMSPQVGVTITLPAESDSMITNHSMESVISALKKGVPI